MIGALPIRELARHRLFLVFPSECVVDPPHEVGTAVRRVQALVGYVCPASFASARPANRHCRSPGASLDLLDRLVARERAGGGHERFRVEEDQNRSAPSRARVCSIGTDPRSRTTSSRDTEDDSRQRSSAFQVASRFCEALRLRPPSLLLSRFALSPARAHCYDHRDQRPNPTPITDERPAIAARRGSRCFGPSILAAIDVRQDYVNF